MIRLFAYPGICHLYGFLIQSFPACLHPHFLNCLISQLLYMETVHHAVCGWKADTCRLFHVRSHVKGYFPDLEASASGKLEQDGCSSPDIRTFYDCNDTSRTSPFLLVYQDCIKLTLEKLTSSIPTYGPIFFSKRIHTSACGCWDQFM